MEMKRCPNGHLYNGDQYSEEECPSCMVEKHFAELAALEGITLAEYMERMRSRRKDSYPQQYDPRPRPLYAGPPVRGENSEE